MGLASDIAVNFQVYETQLIIGDAGSTRSFAESVRTIRHHGIDRIDTVGLPAGFLAIQAGLDGLSIPRDVLLRRDANIELIKDGQKGIEPIGVMGKTSQEITDLLRRDLLERDHDIVLRLFRSPTLIGKMRRHTGGLYEAARLKSTRTTNYEREQSATLPAR